MGRFSLVATVNAGLRGLLIRSNCSRIHARVNAERLVARGLDERREVVEHLLRVDPVIRVLDEPLRAQPRDELVGAALGASRISRPIADGSPRSGSRATAPKSSTPIRPGLPSVAGQHPEVARVRIGVEHPGPGRDPRRGT